MEEGSVRQQATAAAADLDALAVRLGPDEGSVDELHFFVQALDLLQTQGQHLATLELHVHIGRTLVATATAAPEQRHLNHTKKNETKRETDA